MARVREFFYKESKSKQIFEGVGEDGLGKRIFFTKNPNLKKKKKRIYFLFLVLVGWWLWWEGGGGARFSEFLYNESKSKI